MERYYKLDGHQPVACLDVMEWGKAFESCDRIVKKTCMGEVEISTVFLGLNHRFGPGAPLLFETMVFGGSLDQEQNRYETWEQAEAGHDEMIKKVSKDLGG